MTFKEITGAIESSLSLGSFFVKRAYTLRVVNRPHQRIFWEVFQGHLLDERQTRNALSFSAWDLYLDQVPGQATAPLISVKLALDDNQIYVTRNILMHVWEPYESQPNVIESRSTTRWCPELVATVSLTKSTTRQQLSYQLSRGIMSAVIGTSRLPITSLDSPLPDFTLGNFAYFPKEAAATCAGPVRDPEQLIRECLRSSSDIRSCAILLETILRTAAPDQVDCLADAFFRRWCNESFSVKTLPLVVKEMFSHLSLSPYTPFANNWVRLLTCWSSSKRLGSEAVVDLISYILRHIVRHLTAYDLERFHNLGANYPDALLLDEMLKAYLILIEQHASLFTGQRSGGLRRRALRQALMLRCQYEGHRVPDRPTSPGENQRILSPYYDPVPEEQLVDPTARGKRLFDKDPVGKMVTTQVEYVLEQSLLELNHDAELLELGMAVFLDRPLGTCKQPGDIDRTVLLSYEAFSRQVAHQRLKQIWRWRQGTSAPELKTLQSRLDGLLVAGFPVAHLGSAGRPGVVALEDAGATASDFLFLRTTRSSLGTLLRQYGFTLLESNWPQLLDWFTQSRDVLLVRTTGPAIHDGQLNLKAFDANGRIRLVITATASSSYSEVCGEEYLIGLQLTPQLCDNDGSSSAADVFELRPVI